MGQSNLGRFTAMAVFTILIVCQTNTGVLADESINSRPIRRPHYQPVFSRVVRAPEELLSSIDGRDRVIVDEPVPQQYDLVYDAPEVITPTNRATNYARYNPGIFPWTSFRQRIGLSDLAKMKLVGPKRGTSGIRLI